MARMFRNPLPALLLALALPLAAARAEPLPVAADPEPSYEEIIANGEPVPEPEWRQMTRGNTVWYFTGEALWGREYYDMRRDRVMFQFYTGECQPGDWSHDDGIYCFDFHMGPPHCFRHIRYGGRLWVLATGSPMVQEVKQIEPGGFSCDPGLTS